MTISPLLEQLIERLQGTEQLDLEFKECQETIGSSFWETVSAFANTQGGWLLLGVTNKGEPKGVNNPEKIKNEIFQQGRNPQKINVEVWNEHDISIEPLGGVHLLVVRVPVVSRTKRPVYINGNPMTGTYVRRHEGDYHCKEDEVRRMFREASVESVDSTVLLEYDMSSFNNETIARYRQRLQNRTPEHEFNDYAIERFLIALGAADPSTQHPTVAGLLMFGKGEVIRLWRKRHLIDYRQNAEILDDTVWEDRIAWDGNLFDAYFKIYPRLTENIPIPHKIEAGERIEETPQHVALREALVNLFGHADYAETNPSLIIRSPEGFLLRNPGSSRISRYDLFIGNRSDPRNPTLLFIFRLVGLAEEAGSGLPKIIRAWQKLGFQMPNVEVGTERYEFAIVLRNAHLLSEDDRQWLHGYRRAFNESEQLALVYARHKDSIDNETLRSLVPLHPSDATKVLTGLRDQEILRKQSDRRGAYYTLVGGIGDATPSLFDTMKQEESLAVQNKKVTEAAQKVTETRQKVTEEKTLHTEIKKKLKTKLGREEKQKTIDSYILQLCLLRPHSSSELAKIFGMRRDYLQSRYLRKLVDNNKLQWTGKSAQDRTGRYKPI